MTEQYILGEALKELIEHKTNLKVNLTQESVAALQTFSPVWRRARLISIRNIRVPDGTWSQKKYRFLFHR